MSAACERARTWASLALDAELSELERAHLQAHLDECEPCTAFLAAAREVTHELRAAELPAPSRPLAPPTHRGSCEPVAVPKPGPAALPAERVPHQTAV